MSDEFRCLITAWQDGYVSKNAGRCAGNPRSFIAEPKLKETGVGHLKSRGVEGLMQDAIELAAKLSKHSVETKLSRRNVR